MVPPRSSMCTSMVTRLRGHLTNCVAALRKVMGDDVELIAERVTANRAVMCAVAPSLRVEDLQEVDLAGEHVLMPHLNVLLIKRGSGGPAPAVPMPQDPLKMAEQEMSRAMEAARSSPFPPSPGGPPRSRFA